MTCTCSGFRPPPAMCLCRVRISIGSFVIKIAIIPLTHLKEAMIMTSVDLAARGQGISWGRDRGSIQAISGLGPSSCLALGLAGQQRTGGNHDRLGCFQHCLAKSLSADQLVVCGTVGIFDSSGSTGLHFAPASMACGSALRKWRDQVSAFNPLDADFVKLRMRISDIASPITNSVENKRFTDWQIDRACEYHVF